MLALLPLLALLGLWILLGNLRPGWAWRRAFLRAVVLTGSYMILMTEGLSLVRGITPLGLAVAWGLPVAAEAGWLLGRWRAGQGLVFPRLRLPASWLDRILVLVVAVIVVTTGVVAWFAPPNTWDSLTYHMSRIAHWAQDRSLGPFATGIEVQNSEGPGAEIGMLQLYVLARGDHLVNSVQWLAMVTSIVGVSLIADTLGASPFGQLLTAVLAATLPMGIAQASSTMTDYVVSMWMVCVASETLSLIKRSIGREAVVFVSLAAGLAMVTKGTAYPYLLPFALVLGVVLVRRESLGRLARWGVAGLGLILVLNAGQMRRNLSLYGNPLAAPNLVAFHTNELRSLPGLISNLSRNAALHAGTPWPGINRQLFRAIVGLHHVLNVDPNDPRTTSAGEFSILPPSTNEARAGNSLHAWLFLLITAGLFVRPRKVDGLLLVYGLTVVSGLVVFAWVFKWQVFASRLHLPFFILFTPAAGSTLSAAFPGSFARAAAFAVVIASWPWLVGIDNRPLVPKEGSGVTVLTEPRRALYLGHDMAEIYQDVTDRIREGNCSSVGIMIGGDSPEYMLWVFLDAPRSGVRLEWIVAGTPSARFSDPGFRPCAVVCDQTCPEEWTSVAGLPLRYERSGLRLFMDVAGSGSSPVTPDTSQRSG